MPKYIEVEELENLVQHEIDDCKEELATANYESTKGLFYIISAAKRVVTIAKNMPSADVRENIHGEWQIEMEYGAEIYTCSKCGFESADDSNFCSECGADMKGK